MPDYSGLPRSRVPPDGNGAGGDDQQQDIIYRIYYCTGWWRGCWLAHKITPSTDVPFEEGLYVDWCEPVQSRAGGPKPPETERRPRPPFPL